MKYDLFTPQTFKVFICKKNASAEMAESSLFFNLSYKRYLTFKAFIEMYILQILKL